MQMTSVEFGLACKVLRHYIYGLGFQLHTFIDLVKLRNHDYLCTTLPISDTLTCAEMSLLILVCLKHMRAGTHMRHVAWLRSFDLEHMSYCATFNANHDFGMRINPMRSG